MSGDVTPPVTALPLRDYQHELLASVRTALRAHRRVVLQSPTGCHAAGTAIMLADGRSKLVEEIRKGDQLMGPDGQPRAVLVTVWGREPMYRVVPTKGEPFVVNANHILSLTSTNEGKPSGRRARAIVNITVREWLGRSSTFRHVHKLRRVAIDLPSAPRPDLDPYVMGVLLGDGHTDRTVEVCGTEPVVFSAVDREMARHGLDPVEAEARDGWCRIVRYSRRQGTPKQNPVTGILRSLGLGGATSGEKFVPDAYKYTDAATRLAVLAGLLDTDGSLSKKGFDFISKSRRLAEDVVFLSRSLGLAAYLARTIKTCQTGASGIYWRVSISGRTDMVPTRVAYKKAAPRKQKKDPLVTGFGVEPLDADDYYGFYLGGDHLYLTGDFTVHHNSGKTVLTAHMIRTAAARSMSSVFLVHRKELLDQTSGALWRLGVSHGVIAGGRARTKDMVQVATIQTLAKRLGAVEAPRFIIVDEAHHTAAASYRKVLEAWPEAYVVGLTATPCRTDGRGLDDLFDALVPGPTVAWLMERGYLAQYRVICPPGGAVDLDGVRTQGGDYIRAQLEAKTDQASIIGNAVEHYQKYAAGKSCLVYTVTRKHAHHVEEAYRAAGVSAVYCAGDTEAGERRRIIDGFKAGRLPVIVSVDLFGEGLDVPGLFSVQLLRPTASLSLHLQQIGRALRPEGDKVALILDHVGNVGRLMPDGSFQTKHGLPDEDREWTLEGTRKRKKKGDTGPALRSCPECFAIYRATLRACPACGTAVQMAGRSGPDAVEGELVEVDHALVKRTHRMDVGRAVHEASTLEEMVAVAQRFKYKAAWAAVRWAQKIEEAPEKFYRMAERIWRQSTTKEA